MVRYTQNGLDLLAKESDRWRGDWNRLIRCSSAFSVTSPLTDESPKFLSKGPKSFVCASLEAGNRTVKETFFLTNTQNLIFCIRFWHWITFLILSLCFSALVNFLNQLLKTFVDFLFKYSSPPSPRLPLNESEALPKFSNQCFLLSVKKVYQLSCVSFRTWFSFWPQNKTKNEIFCSNALFLSLLPPKNQLRWFFVKLFFP